MKKQNYLTKFLLFFVFFIVISSASAGPAVLVDDVDIAAKPSKTEMVSKVSSSKFSSAIDLRSQRRAGVGMLAFGQVGLAGALIELNFAASDSFVGQFGGGYRYNSLSFQWKHVFGGISFGPYATIGYSRWYNSNASKGSMTNSNPGILVSRFLNEEEKASGQFAKDLFTPSVGFQYYQLSGEYLGSSLYAEVVFLTALSGPTLVPTGATGFIFYF